MSTIDSYIKQTAKKYPYTSKVAEQLEEIRDTLHIKTEEYQAGGLSYEEASQAAINSIGDISALMSAVAGESRTVHVNRLMMHLSVASMVIVSIELLVYFFSMSLPVVLFDSNNTFLDTLGNILLALNFMHVGGTTTIFFWIVGFPLLIAAWVWPLVSIINYIREPQKAGVVQMRAKQQMRIALIGLLVGSVVLFLLNMPDVLSQISLPYITIDVAFRRASLWFVWAIIFLSNWPLIVWNYGRKLRSGKFDV